MTRQQKLLLGVSAEKSMNFQGNDLKLNSNVFNYIKKDFSASSDSFHAASNSYSQAQHHATWIYPYISTVISFCLPSRPLPPPLRIKFTPT